MIVWRGSLPALIYPGGQDYMESPSRVQLDPTTTQSDNFFYTAASSTPIRVVTREVRYIHELSLTLELSMPISSPAAPASDILLLRQPVDILATGSFSTLGLSFLEAISKS